MVDAAHAPATPSDTPISCCTGFYENDWVRVLAEGSFHPGGIELTRRCVDALGLSPGDALLDVGSGAGTSALDLAARNGLRVTGIDPSTVNGSRARFRAAAETTRFAHRPRFLTATASALPFRSATFDAVLAECVISLVPRPERALREIPRVLRPAGQAVITDMVVEGDLPADLARAIAPWTCLLDGRSRNGWLELVQGAGFTVTDAVDESAGLRGLTADLRRRLLAVGATALLGEPSPGAPELPLDELRGWLDRFEAVVDQGLVRYLRLQLRPSPRLPSTP